MHEPRQHPPKRQLCTIPYAAQISSLSPRTIWSLIAAEKLTPYRFGRRCTRLDLAEVEAFIEGAKQQS